MEIGAQVGVTGSWQRPVSLMLFGRSLSVSCQLNAITSSLWCYHRRCLLKKLLSFSRDLCPYKGIYIQVPKNYLFKTIWAIENCGKKFELIHCASVDKVTFLLNIYVGKVWDLLRNQWALKEYLLQLVHCKMTFFTLSRYFATLLPIRCDLQFLCWANEFFAHHMNKPLNFKVLKIGVSKLDHRFSWIVGVHFKQ